MTDRRADPVSPAVYFIFALIVLGFAFACGYVQGMKRINREYKKMFDENFYAIGMETVRSLYSSGLSVSDVYSGTPAEKAGIRKFDVILSVNFAAATFDNLKNYTASPREVRLEIRRGDQIFRVLVIPEVMKRKTILIPME